MHSHRKKGVILTYGTFDILHIGHVNLLRRARALGDCLIVGLSTEEFNELKHKETFLSYAQRRAVLEALRYVDRIIPERTWEQKAHDIKKYGVDVLVMGHDWRGKFDHLKKYCKVVYLSRTPSISTTSVKGKVYRSV